MMLEPAGEGVGQAREAELGARPEHELGAQAAQVGAELGGGGEVVEREVARGDRVDRVLGDAVEAELGGDGCAVELVVEPDRGPGAERQLETRLARGRQAAAVAVEHPDVGEQVLGERGDLGALEVRVGGQQGLDVPCRPLEQHALQRAQRRVLPLDDAPQVQAHVGHDLVVAAAPGVQLRPGVARQLGEPALDRHVDVLVLVARHERAVLDLAADGGEPFFDGSPLRRVEHAGLLERVRVRDAALDVLAPEAPVEGQRRVEGHERGVALAGEATRARDAHGACTASSPSSLSSCIMPCSLPIRAQISMGRPQSWMNPAAASCENSSSVV